jgi:hypothetical protein
MDYYWPGNVRASEHRERAILITESNTIFLTPSGRRRASPCNRIAENAFSIEGYTKELYSNINVLQLAEAFRNVVHEEGFMGKRDGGYPSSNVTLFLALSLLPLVVTNYLKINYFTV